MHSFILKSLLLAVIWIGSADAALSSGGKQPFHFMAISDIHFDPFVTCQSKKPCPLIAKLEHAPAKDWAAMLSVESKHSPTGRQDANYALFKASLSSAKQAALKYDVQFVVISGDFLAHHYKNRFKQYSSDYSTAHYQLFVKKTFEFMTYELAKTFPTIDVYPVVGNNDTYNRNYSSTPRGAFFHDTAYLFASLSKEKRNLKSILSTFPIAGYYAVDIPGQPEMRLLVLNTVLFSYKAKGADVAQAANEEFDWLHEQLMSAKQHHQKVLIAMHIPPTVDIYLMKNIRLLTALHLWKSIDTQQFQQELDEFAPEIQAIIAGHLHYDYMHSLPVYQGRDIPMLGVPAVSTLFGGASGFEVYQLSPESTDSIHDFYQRINS